MKKLFYSLIASSLIILTSCETVHEITLNENGTGIYKGNTDMSAAITMAKQFSGGQMKDADKMKMDTSVSLAAFADSIPGLTPAEKELVKKGNWAMNIDVDGEKFISKLDFPFEKAEQVNNLNKLLTANMVDKVFDQMKKGDGAGGMPPGMDGDKQMPSLDDYFTLTMSNGVIEKKLNKEKYATADKDESLGMMKQLSGMGASVSNTYIFNLPRAAKKAEGKGVKLSDDKKKVTIVTSSEDFFDDPAKFEFRIEY